MCKVWKRRCVDCKKKMMLSGPSTSETHPGHREPCQTYRRLQAECGNRLENCLQEVPEKWHGTDGPRKCDTCRKVTSEKAKIRRTARKAKIAARKLEIQRKRRGQEFNTIASATSLEAAEAADDVKTPPPVQAQEPMIHQVNTLPPVQAQEQKILQTDPLSPMQPQQPIINQVNPLPQMQAKEPMIHQDQDTILKTEPLPPPPYSETQNDEDVFWNLNPDTIAWEALLYHEDAQVQPKEKEEQQEQVKEQEQVEVIEERSTTAPPPPSPPSAFHHQYPAHPPPPYNHHPCSCGGPQRHKIGIHLECSLKILMLFDALILDQFIINIFEYDPTWRAECGAVLSREEQSDVLDVFFRAVKEGFGEVVGEQQGAGFESG